jgi:hypothetical protein
LLAKSTTTRRRSLGCGVVIVNAIGVVLVVIVALALFGVWEALPW